MGNDNIHYHKYHGEWMVKEKGKNPRTRLGRHATSNWYPTPQYPSQAPVPVFVDNAWGIDYEQ